jgi:hypothetical protein
MKGITLSEEIVKKYSGLFNCNKETKRRKNGYYKQNCE